MNQPPLNHEAEPQGGDDRFVWLTCRYLDDVLVEDEFIELDAMLSSDGELTRRFTRLCLQARLMSEPLADRIRWLIDTDRSATLTKPQTTGVRWTLWRSAIAAMLVFAGAVGLIVAMNLAGHRADVAPQPMANVATIPIATITGANDVDWLSDPLNLGEDVSPRVLSIGAGTLDIQLFSGVAMTIIGPAQVDLRQPMHVRIDRGTLYASVSHSAIGFTVESPGCRVIDRGTVFAITVDAAGATTQVSVIEGSVDAMALDAGGRIVDTRRLSVGTTCRVSRESQQIAIDEVTPQKQYSRHVMYLRPTAYWPMNQPDASAMRDVIGQRPTVNHAEAHFEATGPFNAAYRFDGKPKGIDTGIGQLLPELADFTITLWLRTSQQSQGHLVSDNWGFAGRANFYIEDGLLKWFIGSEPQVHLDSPGPVADDRWHMAGLTRRDGLFTLYIDGQIVGSLDSDETIAPAKSTWVLGGSPTGHHAYTGWLTQTAVFDRALSADQINALYKLAPEPSEHFDPTPASQSSRSNSKQEIKT
ncbi:hypothetical protein HED60_06460 [Planctomycetales bacterium ZRK34]|nr:hypothetical protein HED60_06460 [Planctomycetales bacterium ZRK34]